MAELRHNKRAKEAGGAFSLGADKSEEDSAKAKDTENLTSGLGSGKAAKGGGAGMPKQDPGESASAFGARMRDWREKKRSGVTMDHAATAIAARAK